MSDVRLVFEPGWQHLAETFEPLPGLPVPPGDYRSLQTGLQVATDQSARLSGSLQASAGGFYDGRRRRLELVARWAPTARAVLSARYERNDLEEIGLAEASRTTELFVYEAQLAAGPRLRLTVSHQRDTVSGRAIWNGRLAWEYRPLSYFYVVYNENGPLPSVASPSTPRGQQLIVKASFLTAL